MPPGRKGGGKVDTDYLAALRKAVPREGIAWTYTHSRDYRRRFRPSKAGETVINSSCDTVSDMLEAKKRGHPAVTVAPYTGTNFWINQMRDRYGLKIGICPAELTGKEITCDTCGSDEGPWCAWNDRDFVVAFTAHGAGKTKADKRWDQIFEPDDEDISEEELITLTDDPAESGGCYAAYWHARREWDKAADARCAHRHPNCCNYGSEGEYKSDGEVILKFANDQPVGGKIRHHVAGDMLQDESAPFPC
tara:strand:+ start:446 stop:1192 length:747 start_codon:yes stop_codon:yes gene_type:complete